MKDHPPKPVVEPPIFLRDLYGSMYEYKEDSRPLKMCTKEEIARLHDEARRASEGVNSQEEDEELWAISAKDHLEQENEAAAAAFHASFTTGDEMDPVVFAHMAQCLVS